MRIIYSLLIVAIVLNSFSFAKGEECHSSDHHHKGDAELAISTGYIHLVEDNESGVGLHIHRIKMWGDDGFKQYFGGGIGAEVVLAENTHYAIMLPFAAYPWRGLVVSFAPGFQIAKHEGKNETAFSMHYEAAYSFEIGKFDMGPVVDYSATKEESHFMVGIHVGLHF